MYYDCVLYHTFITFNIHIQVKLFRAFLTGTIVEKKFNFIQLASTALQRKFFVIGSETLVLTTFHAVHDHIYSAVNYLDKCRGDHRDLTLIHIPRFLFSHFKNIMPCATYIGRLKSRLESL